MSLLNALGSETPTFFILRASAGSGKTFSLVRVFLALCLRESDPRYFRHILAITFTNKAANEMKDRVLKAMREAGRGEGAHLDALEAELGLSRNELRKRASRVYEEMMTNYGLLSIMTIDKFVNRLVRSFSREMALDSEFRILLNQDDLIREGVDLLLSRVGDANPALTKVIERYALQRVDDEQGWDMRKDLVRFGKLLFNEQFAPMLSALEAVTPEDFMQRHHDLNAEIHAAYAAVEVHAREALEAIAEAGLTEKDFSRSMVPSFFQSYLNGERKMPSPTLIKMFSGEANAYTAKTPAEIASAITELMPTLTEHFEAVIAIVGGEQGAILRMKEALAGSMFQLATLRELEVAVSEVRLARNVMTFSDLNRMIELLVSNNPAPFIYERLGERYRHFLIDEFQDTSIVQWQNFLPLVDESLARGHFNLIVGDGKQAIYRWRNGDVRQLQHMPEIIGRTLTPEMELRQETLRRTAQQGALEDNWRSLEAVVNFNNRFFTALGDVLDEEHRSIYAQPQQNPKGGAGGWITCEAYYERRTAEMHELRMERITRLIEENRAAGYSLRDITILVRDNGVGRKVARSLVQADVATVTAESLQLGQHPAPWAVMALMKWLNDRGDMAAAAWFLQCHPSLEEGREALDETFFTQVLHPAEADPKNKRKGYKLTLEPYLSGVCGINDADYLVGKPLYDTVNALVDLLGVGARYPAYAEALLQMAHAYQTEENEGIPGFIQFWENEGYKKSISVPEEIDGVRIMTVHKSKGLEFPVVIHLVAGPSSNAGKELHPVETDSTIFGVPMGVVPLNKLNDTWAHETYLAEKRRLLLDDVNVVYVGMTRAARHLHVLIEANEASIGPEEYNVAKLSAAIIEAQLEGSIFEEIQHVGFPISPCRAEAKKARSIQHLEALKSTATSERLKVSVRQDQMPTHEGALTPQQFGNELHALLAKVRQSADLVPLKKLRAPWQRMRPEDWQHVVATAEKVVSHSASALWFSEKCKVFPERELMIDNGDTVRPDRVVELDGELLVIDFKSGAEDEKHRRQVQEYLRVLRQAEPGKPVRGLLLYTDRMQVVEVDQPTLF